MVDKLYELKNHFIKRVEKDINDRGIDRINVDEMGELVDMVKDLAEAESYCWQAEYYRTVTEAMKNEKSSGYGSMSGRSGYNQTQTNTSIPGRAGYMPQNTGSSGYHDVTDPIRMAMQNASPEERERLRKELRDMIG